MLSLHKVTAALRSVASAIGSFIVQDDPYEKDEIRMELYNASGACVLGKKYFTHLRRWVDDPHGWDVELSNYGGATLCWVIEKGRGDEYYFFYTWSECSLKPDPVTKRPDQFCKKTGREVCLANFSKYAKLHTEVRNACPSVEEARDYVIQQYKICKKAYYPNVDKEFY